jgi:hypothetical protein
MDTKTHQSREGLGTITVQEPSTGTEKTFPAAIARAHKSLLVYKSKYNGKGRFLGCSECNSL